MTLFAADAQSAIRSLRRTPWFAFWVVLLLSLTLGANAVLFSVVQTVVLRPLPFDEPERLAWIWSTRTDRDHAFFSLPDFRDFRDQNRTLEHFAVFTGWGGNRTGAGGAERLRGVQTTANTFELLGVRAQVGRVLQAGDGRPDSPAVMVITHGLWQRSFGGGTGVVGQTVTLSGQTFTIVGVLPRNFLFPGAGPEFEFAVPLIPEIDPRNTNRVTSFLRGFARLKPAVSLQQAFEDLAAINARLKELYPEVNAKKTPPRFFPLHAEILGDFRAALLALLGAVLLVLLLAAVNLANLLLVRAMAREKEFAVRMALGASARQLARMLLAESLLLAATSGVVALVLTRIGLGGLLRLFPATLPRAGEIEFGATAAAFTLAAALLAGVLMALGPARRAGRAMLRGALAAESRAASADRSRRWGLEALVFVEVAIATLLLAGTGLFLKSYSQLQAVSPGFEPQNVLMVRPSLSPEPYADPAALQRFTETFQRELAAIPGVESAAMASALPMMGTNTRLDFAVAGRPPAKLEDVLTAQNKQVSPDYFRTMRIPLIEGREFAAADHATAQRVVIVDETLARQHFPGRSALGQHLIIEKQDNLIVGVVGEVKHFGLDDLPLTTFYQPLAQIGKVQASFAVTRPGFVLRTSVEPLSLVPQVRAALQRIDPLLPVTLLRTMDQYLEMWIAPRRFNLQLLAAFATFAVVLTGLGTYAVLAAAARQRTHEIGIRVALGASRGSIVQLILRRSLLICGAGILLGAVAARFSAQSIRTLLYRVEPFDISIFGGVALLVLAVGIAASLAPAWRASRVDPASSLRGY